MKEITKKQFVRLCFTLIGIGILIMSLAYMRLSRIINLKDYLVLGIFVIGNSIIGGGVGLALSRDYLIKDFERRIENGNKRKVV
jgi:hypothetical protein